ncbi:ABC transporter substrate-binding protein [Alteribacillus bidgolensis]|uniref:Putative hydroxymethylpyrimidine transport system substrate-binding protein n=1 Tax=Alteribacillus bidgolensis TaxID=930129 RepID=A0A1G8HI34_9BACI|nr:ABC transporter substrate-binding protein [Alteribacillus bidgolensis]SDI06222.1 putative hydroxymethylpyrimidine transport system substrate-binding protein [Alteribacillus bidgolensis]
MNKRWWKTNKRKNMAWMLAFSITALGACNADESNEEDSQAGDEDAEEELQEVDVMLDWYPNAVHSYLYAAQEKGYFEEEGLDVNIQFPTNPTDPLNLAATGEVDLGITYQPDVITARNEGVPVVSVAAIVRSPLNHVVHLEGADIDSPQDLEGKKVGYPGIPVNEPILETMVEEDGGNFDEVELIDIGFELNSAIVTERTDAVVGAYINHEVPVLEHEGHEVDYLNPVDYGVPPFYELVMVTNEENIENNEEKIRSFWAAAEKGYEFMKENPDESLDILLDHQDQENFPLKREVEEESLEVLLDKMETEEEPFGSQSAESWKATMEWLNETGYIEETPETEEIFMNLE